MSQIQIGWADITEENGSNSGQDQENGKAALGLAPGALKTFDLIDASSMQVRLARLCISIQIEDY